MPGVDRDDGGSRSPRRRWPRLAVIRAVALAAMLAGAPESPAQAPEGPSETVEVRLIELAVTATDRAGEPIADLSPDEIGIELYRSRKRRDVDAAPMIELAGLRRAESDTPFDQDPVRLTIETGATSATFSSGDREPRYLVLLIDVANIESSQHDKVRQDLQRFVRDRIGPQDVAAVLSFNGQLNFEAPFHSGPDDLAAAIERAFARPVVVAESMTRRLRNLSRELRACEYVSDNPFTRTEGGEEDAFLSDEGIAPDNGCVRGTVDNYVRSSDNRAVGLSSAFLAAIELVAGVRDEASVYAITPGVSVDPSAEVIEAVSGIFGRTMSARMASTFAVADRGAGVLDDAVEAARAHRVVVHVVDPNVGSEDSRSAGRPSASVGGARPIDVARESARASVGRVADATGGRFARGATVADALTTSADAGHGRYVLHIMTDTVLSAEDIARIRIDSTRRPIEIRTVDAGDVANRTERRMPGSIQVDAPGPGVGDTVGESSRSTWPFAVSVPAAALGYVETSEGWVAELTLHVLVQTVTGRELVGSYAFLHHAVLAEQWATFRNGPVTVRGSVDAPDGEYRLIALVRNASSGISAEMIGTLEVNGAEDR